MVLKVNQVSGRLVITTLVSLGLTRNCKFTNRKQAEQELNIIWIVVSCPLTVRGKKTTKPQREKKYYELNTIVLCTNFAIFCVCVNVP